MFFAEIEYYSYSTIGFFKISRSVSKLIVIFCVLRRRVRDKLAGVAKVMLLLRVRGVKNDLIRFTWFVHFPKNAYSPGKYCASCISIFDLIAPIPNLQPWVLLAQ